MKVYTSSTALLVFSMVGVCVSSTLDILLCVTSLSQCKDLMKVSELCFISTTYLQEKECLKCSLIRNLRYYGTPHLKCQRESIILYKICGCKYYCTRIRVYNLDDYLLRSVLC